MIINAIMSFFVGSLYHNEINDKRDEPTNYLSESDNFEGDWLEDHISKTTAVSITRLKTHFLAWIIVRFSWMFHNA